MVHGIGLRVGQVVAEPGALAASAATFSIEVVGRGAHGARPHESADPVVGAAEHHARALGCAPVSPPHRLAVDENGVNAEGPPLGILEGRPVDHERRILPGLQIGGPGWTDSWGPQN